MKKYRLLRKFPGFAEGDYVWISEVGGSHWKEIYDSPDKSQESHVLTWNSGTIPEFDEFFEFVMDERTFHLTCDNCGMDMGMITVDKDVDTLFYTCNRCLRNN